VDLGTISTDRAETVMERDATARDVWLALETQFLGNRETRALHLDYQFRNFVQGELSITDYCRHFKTMADGLAALGESVSDRTLVLNVIRGLNDRFSDIDRHLRRGRPSPLFKDVVSELTLEEMTMAHKAAAPPTALLATTARPSSTTPSSGGGRASDQRPPSGGGSGSGGASSKLKQRRSKQRGGKSSGNPPATGGTTTPSGTTKGAGSGASTAPWPSLHNPWAGSIQMWPGPRPPSPLAPLPLPTVAPQQQALLAQAHAQA